VMIAVVYLKQLYDAPDWPPLVADISAGLPSVSKA
jgi:hypothetical protein